MKKKSSCNTASQIETLPLKPKKQPQDQRREIFNLEVALGSTTTPDPFAMPPTGNGLFAHFELWRTLEDEQHPFEPPHPLAYGGTLNYDWHSFLRGAMNPFIEALGVLSPLARGNTPSWAVKSANECLKDAKSNASASRPCAVGWCLGFGIAAAKKFEEWNVSLKDLAKASPELKQYLFSEAAARAESETETVRIFLNGFCDGIQAGQAIEEQDHIFKWKLFVALKWSELNELSRGQVTKLIRQQIPTKEAFNAYQFAEAMHKAAVTEWHKMGKKSAEPAAPRLTSLYIGDATIQAVCLRLRDNPRGLLQKRDELSGWLGSFDQYTDGNEAAQWLEFHSANSLKIDRADENKPTIFIPRALVVEFNGRVSQGAHQRRVRFQSL